jgi:peroxiredoxin
VRRPIVSLFLSLLLLVATTAGAAAERDDEAPLPATRPLAADFSAESLEHREIALSALRGKVVLLQYWASWCPTCVAEFPALRRLHAEHAEAGLEIVGISLDEEIKDARRAVARHEMHWPQICDGLGKDSPLATRYDVRGTPRYVLIDRQGRVAAAYLKPSELERRVREIMEQE